MFGDALAKEFVDRGNAGFAIEFQEIVALGDCLEFALDHGLVAYEGPVQIVRERHVAASFPVADGLGFAKFAAEGGLRANVQPKSEMRTQSHGVKSAEVIAIDAANHAASDEREDIAVGENHGAGFERWNNTMFELIEKVGAVHQRESQARDGVF